MLPKSYEPLEAIFQSVKENIEQFRDVEFHFIGTGKTPGDENGFNVKSLAEKFGLWQTLVFEYPKRIPYLDVLVHLNSADGIFILGSTEPHYTPSKIYQGVLSKKPIFAVLHSKSTAVNIIRESRSGQVLDFDGEADVETIRKNFAAAFKNYLEFMSTYDPEKIDKLILNEYSAYAVTSKLAKLLEKII